MTNSSPSKYAMTFIFLTVLLDMVGFGLIIPVQPALIKDVGHMDVGDASIIAGWMFFAFSATQFLFGPALGSLSDAYGRRPLLLLAVFGLGIDYLITALAPSIFWLFVGRTFAGLCGTSYVIANAYIADITAPENRAKAFGMMGAAFGLGFVIGPAIGGLLGAFGPRVPFYVAAAVSMLNLVFGWFALPETLSKDQRRPFDAARANPIGTFKVFASYPNILPLSLLMAIYFFGSSVYPAGWAFWGNAKYGWTPETIGLTLACFGIVMAFVQGVLTGPAVKLMGERGAAMLGLFMAIICTIGFANSPSLGLVLFFLVLHSPEGFVHPMLSALMSKEVPADAQGELQGGISSIMSLSMLFGTVFFSQIFGYFLKPGAWVTSPDVIYYIASALFVTTLLLFLVIYRPKPDKMTAN
jgi:DHA1 family tetracycline resistance protein-like MFS transporter